MEEEGKKLLQIFVDLLQSVKEIEVTLDIENSNFKKGIFSNPFFQIDSWKPKYCFERRNGDVKDLFFSDYNNKNEKEIFRKLLKRKDLLRSYYGKSRNVNTVTALHSQKRCIFRTESVLEGRHVNGGVTFFRDNEPIKMMVLRREEVLKVFVHEMLHVLRPMLDDTNFSKTLRERSKGDFGWECWNSDIAKNEAYTEYDATMLNIVFTCLEMNDEEGLLLPLLLKVETMRSVFVCRKLKENIKKETTNGIAYYFLKTAGLLKNYTSEEFLNCNYSDLITDKFLSIINTKEKCDIFKEKYSLRMTLTDLMLNDNSLIPKEFNYLKINNDRTIFGCNGEVQRNTKRIERTKNLEKKTRKKII